MSYDFGDHFVDFGSHRLAFRIWTLENVYGVDPERLHVQRQEGRITLSADGFLAAGGHIRSGGTFHAEVWKAGDEVRVTAQATHAESIKSLGVLVKGLPNIVAAYEYPWTATQPDEIMREIPVNWPHVVTLKYPLANLGPFPIFLYRSSDGERYYALNMDERVRPKRSAVHWDKHREQTLDLIFEQAAVEFRGEIVMPEWRFGRVGELADVFAPRLQIMEEKWGLRPWAERSDVPAWLRKVSLVVTMHGEHWTGYPFNTYSQMLAHLQFIARHIEGLRALVYIPGWDGRYYFNYPLYRPSERLGGESGFRKLVDGAHALGMHVVPMFGLNAINLKWARQLGLEDVIAHTAQGWEDIVNFLDWDGDRSGQEQVHWANPGNPRYQDHLVARASEVVEQFGVDGIFYDIANWYVNDPRWDYFEGVRGLCTRLKERFPGILLFGEGWYDALLPLMPLYHTQIFPAHLEAFTRYARSAYHLSMPAPGAGSTGVHEGGWSDYVAQKLSPILIPTLPIVDDTLPQHEHEVLQIIEVAKEYAGKMLNTK